MTKNKKTEKCADLKGDKIECVRDSKGRWVKGIQAYPSSAKRHVAEYSETTRKFIVIKKVAAEHAGKAFKMIWDAMEDGQPWAFQIYFKELFKLPKNFGEKTVILETAEKTVEGQIKVITEALPSFDEVTHEDALDRLKVLNAVKGNQPQEIIIDDVRESKESLQEKVEMIQTILEYKNK